jgi:PAS domain S-box-containing protein
MPSSRDYSDLSRAQLLEILGELQGMLRDHERPPSPRPAALGPSKLESALSEQRARSGAPQRVVPHPELLAAIVEASADAISSRTLDGTLLTWNKGAEKVYGYTAEEAIGRNYLMLFPESSEVEAAEINARLLRGESIFDLESVRKRKDGSELRQPGDAATIARKMLSLLAGEYIVAGQKLLVTSSLGISIYPDHARDPSLLIRLADKAMYDAKQAGRNSYCLYPPKVS